MTESPDNTNNHTGLILAAVAAAAVAAGIAYLYLTEDGEELRGDLTHKFKEDFKDLASGAISNVTNISRDTLKKVADLVIK